MLLSLGAASTAGLWSGEKEMLVYCFLGCLYIHGVEGSTDLTLVILS